jgi:predicted nucleic acid-binding protein
MTPILVDSNVLLDLSTQDPSWCEWSRAAVTDALNSSLVVINPVVYAEVSVRFDSVDDLDRVLPERLFAREPIPFEAAFLAGKALARYRKRGGVRTATLPDFFIGAHAAVQRYRLLTRDPRRYREYFPTVELIAPE